MNRLTFFCVFCIVQFDIQVAITEESILESSKSKAALTVSSDSDEASAIFVSKDLEAIPVPGIIKASTATPANNHELMLNPVFHASETTSATVSNDLEPTMEAAFTQSQTFTVEPKPPVKMRINEGIACESRFTVN
ncbi:hypothetical protein FQA39_LY01960 [Lamprigera yunnana]|nr:hypothetical protein FQA39_LY01960 [Lamprigera yunnana]